MRISDWSSDVCSSDLCADIGVEGRAVHRPFDGPGGDEAVLAQARNKGLGPPFAEGRIGKQARSPQAAPAQRGHVGLHTGFIDEDTPPGLAEQEWLAELKPFTARCF